MAWRASLLAGRYRILEMLGEGGEARVFRGIDSVDESEVAIRVPKIPGSAGARGVAEPHHAGWVHVLANGMDDETGVYQVLELLRGETLRQKVQREPLSETAWKNFVMESLAAVEALHVAGWVHGDLNAENFLMIAEMGRWKLLELPFLHFSSLKERSTAFGSIYTISPEQLQGRPIAITSDFYALGCLYYFAASGEWPHPGTRAQDVAVSILRFDPQALGPKAGHLSSTAAQGVMRLLDRDPAQRCGSAAEARRWLAIA